MQREQLDEQQKMLTNKTQRFSSLQQQQQQRHKVQVADKNERLSLLRDRIREKEAKLKKLKSIKALVLEQGKTNNSCSKELELMKNSFDQKEHELARVIDKMEMLTRKLKELHQERSSPKNADGDTGSFKKEKLQCQIKECNLMNEQNAKLLQQKQEVLTHRLKQIAEFEQRISKVRARLSSNHQRTKHAAANRRLDVPLKDSWRTESSTTNQSVVKCASKYKTLPHGLKFADVDLVKTVENPGRGKVPVTNETSVKSDFAGQSSKSRIDYATAEDDGKEKSVTVCQKLGSASELQNRGVDVIDGSHASSALHGAGILSKAASEEPSSTGYRISNHNHLLNHFASRPYDSKYSSAKSNPVLSPSDLLSNNISVTSESETETATGSISDSTEILITDPPALTPAGCGPTEEAGVPLGINPGDSSPLYQTRGGSRICSSGTDSMTSYASQSPETKAESVEVRKMAQPPSTITSSDWKKTVGHVVSWVSSSRQQSSSSSEAAQTSDVKPPSETVAVSDKSPSDQVENAAVEWLTGKGERVLSKEVAGKSKMSDARYQFFFHSRSGAAQVSSSPKRKAASFDETFSDSRSTEVQLQRVAGSFQSSVSPQSNASQASSSKVGSPKTSETIAAKPQNAKPVSWANTSLCKTDSRVSTVSEPKPKTEPAKAIVPKDHPSGSDASNEALPSRFPWSSKSKDLKLKLLDLIQASSSPSKAASESRLQSPKPGSGRFASPLAHQGLSSGLKNVVEQKPALDTAASASAQDELKSAGSTEAYSQLYGSDSGFKDRSDSEAGEGGQNSVQSSIPEPVFSRTGYQHAAKNITAKMYLQKLGTEVVDQHSKDFGQLYGRFSSGMSGEEHSVQMVESAQPFHPTEGNQKTEVTSEKRPFRSSQSAVSVDFKVADKPEVEVISKKVEELPAGRGMAASVVGPDLGRPIHKPIIPRPVRRRMSSGDMSEDYLGKANHRDENSSSSHSSGLVLSPNTGSGVLRRQSDNPAHNPDDSCRYPASGFQSPSVEPDPRSVEKKTSFSRQPFRRQGNLKRAGKPKLLRRVSFEPLALLLDASLEGELDLVEKTAREVPDVSASNDEGITALHNAICAGHFDIVKFLVEFGCDVNSPDSDGWTPLHCAASCNNLAMVQFLVEHGACIFATTFSDQELASAKCEEDEDGYDTCSQYLRDIQDRMGFVNDGVVYAVFDYEAENPDELSFRSGDRILVLRKGDDCEQEWWWSRMADNEGYVPRNLVGLLPRVVPQWLRNVHPAS